MKTEPGNFFSERLDLSRIRWVELVSRSRIKVRTAKIVDLAISDTGTSAAWSDQVLKIETTAGKECYVPLRHVVRFDLSDE